MLLMAYTGHRLHDRLLGRQGTLQHVLLHGL